MKKTKINQLPALLAVGLFLSITSAGIGFGQKKEKQEKDPYTRKGASSQTADIAKPETTIVIGVQLAEVPSAKIREWDEEGLTGNEWRERVQKLVDAGEAKIVDSVAGSFLSGTRGRFRSVMQMRYPTVLEQISDSPDDPPFPKEFATSNHGISFEADPVLNAAHDELDLNFAIEWSRYLGEAPGARTETDRVQATDVLEPLFSFQKTTRQARLPIGEYQVLSRIEPNDPEKKDDFAVIIFGRADLVVASPIVDQEAVSAVKELLFRATWVEVDAETWHAALHKNSLSTWFGGKAWENVLAWEKDGSAKIIASTAIGSPSGQRAKVEIAELLSYQDSFPVPGGSSDRGEESRTSKMEERQLGHVFEVDPVMGINGIIHFNQSTISKSLHGYSTSYRKLEGSEWVPFVQFPKFYESSITAQVYLGENSDFLVGVGTPSLEDGQPDTSRKWVFFIHNDTFDTE